MGSIAASHLPCLILGLVYFCFLHILLISMVVVFFLPGPLVSSHHSKRWIFYAKWFLGVEESVTVCELDWRLIQGVFPPHTQGPASTVTLKVETNE